MRGDLPAHRPGSLGRRAALGALPAVTLAAAGCAPSAPAVREAAPGQQGGTKAGAQPSSQRGVTEPPAPYVLLTSYDLRHADQAAVTAALLAWPGGRGAGPTGTVVALPGLYRALGLRTPALLREPPRFPGDRLDPARSGGHLLVLWAGPTAAACREEAGRFTASTHTALAPRWRQEGFLPPTTPGATPRNLFGFKDGTENPPPSEYRRWLWHPDGSTYLVYRRIHMDTRGFAALPPSAQERVVGRHRDSGAPLGGTSERDPVDLYAKTPEGQYVIPVDAHVRLAHSRLDQGARMLRRGYSYDDGPAGRGLLFLAFMRDPALFTRVQQRLSESDAMNRFTEHRASAVGYVLPRFGEGRPVRWN
ncbi:hypothetical protein GCM10010329_58350 [Streptomyces spiroverticillatus]|uniref:Dyp-type peroxidase C-terminal domain-containing protein n=1 Tax=Streptomyces finlayi TaxID=67296 RepID=A0A919CD19_9ACTN|nr:hypothetical protein GCM10010329_58350 [Streptomyces spiroverticillatus]GHD08572.1 hypothetical protein GCM10010334_62010 [Streptomyces finlayi]